jgi:hypothetical protein
MAFSGVYGWQEIVSLPRQPQGLPAMPATIAVLTVRFDVKNGRLRWPLEVDIGIEFCKKIATRIGRSPRKIYFAQVCWHGEGSPVS